MILRFNIAKLTSLKAKQHKLITVNDIPSFTPVERMKRSHIKKKKKEEVICRSKCWLAGKKIRNTRELFSAVAQSSFNLKLPFVSS